MWHLMSDPLLEWNRGDIILLVDGEVCCRDYEDGVFTALRNGEVVQPTAWAPKPYPPDGREWQYITEHLHVP